MPNRPRLAELLSTPEARRGLQMLLAVLVGIVTWLALTPHPPPTIDTGWDKSNHALAFAVLAGNAALAFQHVHRRDRRCAIGLLVYGGLIEIAQTFVPGRSGEWLDLLADAVGIAIGLALVRGLERGLRM